jgi:hypothetical protein
LGGAKYEVIISSLNLEKAGNMHKRAEHPHCNPLEKVLSVEQRTARPTNQFLHTEGVTGSIPVTPTIQTLEIPKFLMFSGVRGEVLGRFSETWRPS